MTRKHRTRKWILLLVVFTFLLPLGAGCEKRREASTTAAVHSSTPVFEDDSTYVFTILIDLSGSFANQMAEQGKAYQFAKHVIDRYFRNRIGTHDKIVIAQISGTDRALLWQGTPVQLRQDFQNPMAFRDALMAKANPNGSFVNESVAQAVEYILSDPAVSSKQAKSAVFVLSDMLDNGPNPKESEEKVMKALAAYGRHGGVVGVYYVDQHLLPVWRQRLTDSGVKFCAEGEFVGRPNLPNFE